MLRGRQRVLREQAGGEGRDLAAAQERREALDAAVTADREQLSAVAIETAALRVRLENVAEGLRRDVDASEEKALAAPRPDLADGIVPEEHLASLEAEIRRIGPVNPLAAAEYKELAERAAFLEGQLADLEGSRRELRKVIAALDEEIARLFREACDDIGRRFEENVGVLFPGGRGRLLLTDPDDPLASGVEIHVQPMGKKISRLAMLSGGERSLAALAFLFAVFRARPSPFYVLDEVEAALDDTNLRRFIRLFGSLRDSSQLVVITHQQQTMEAADMLYGVTMEPGESSRVLAKRFDRAARAVAAGAGGGRPEPAGGRCRRVTRRLAYCHRPQPCRSQRRAGCWSSSWSPSSPPWRWPRCWCLLWRRRRPRATDVRRDAPTIAPAPSPPAASRAAWPGPAGLWGSVSPASSAGGLDEAFWTGLEEALLAADVGVAAAVGIVERVRAAAPGDAAAARGGAAPRGGRGLRRAGPRPGSARATRR